MLTLILRLYPFLRKKLVLFLCIYQSVYFLKMDIFSKLMRNYSFKVESYQLWVRLFLFLSPAISKIKKMQFRAKNHYMAESIHKKNHEKVILTPFSQAPIENKNSRLNLISCHLPMLQKCYEGLGETTCCEALWIVRWIEFGSGFSVDGST